MKIQKSIDHYSAKEREALYALGNLITTYLNPLIIYCLTTHSTATVERSCFTRIKRNKEWSFECDLLVILPNDVMIIPETNKQVEQLTASTGKVTVIIHPFDFFVQKVKEKNPFFSQAYRRAAVLYEREEVAGLLADRVAGGV